MAQSATHRGWLLSRNNGILAGVYDGAIGGASVLGTNTALDGVLVGTPVTPALAVDSLILSNTVASGDVLVAANNGGNSQAWLWVDSSAGTMTLYGAGTAAAIVSATAVEVEDGILLALGNDQDQVLVNRTTILATNTALTGVIVGTPVTPAIAANSLILSNVTASGDILVAANLAGNSQAWIWVDSSAGTMTLYGAGTTAATVSATAVTIPDDILVGIGTGNTARFSYDTTDANANELLLQMPAGGATDVPVLVIGQSIESVDLGLYDGVVDPRIAMFGVGAVTTGPVIEFRKARGTVASPTVVTTGDDVGTLRGFAAVAAGEYVQTAEIRFDCAGTIATTRGPGTITFLTATDAAPSVLTQAMIISAAQVVTMASTAVVQGASVTVGVAGTTTGTLILAGATSGTCTLTPAAAAGSWTMTLPAAANTNAGYQLTCAGTDSITSWSGAASLRELKDIQGTHDAQDALDKILNTKVYDFHYKPGKGTGDGDTQYVGVIADEAPWAMHYKGEVVNPVNVLGYSLLGIQALHDRIRELEHKVAGLAA